MQTETKNLTRILYYEYLPAVLIAKRKELNMSCEQIGEQIGLHGVTIWRIEKGSNADYASVVRYCQALEIPLSSVILSETDKPVLQRGRKKILRKAEDHA